MKTWLLFVLCTVLCWGAYVPVLHHGQQSFGKDAAFRAFLFVGVSYFLLAGVILVWLFTGGDEPPEFNRQGITFSLAAGVLGAFGALGIIFALKNGGRPPTVIPLVFAGAPIVGTCVGLLWHRPVNAPSTWFYLGIGLAAGGAALVLANKPT